MCSKIKIGRDSITADFWRMRTSKLLHWKKVTLCSLIYSLHQPTSLPRSSRQVWCSCKHINMRWIWLLHARALHPPPHTRTTSVWQSGSTLSREQVINPCQLLLKPSQAKQNTSYWAVTPKETLYERKEGASCLVCSPAVNNCLFSDVIKWMSENHPKPLHTLTHTPLPPAGLPDHRAGYHYLFLNRTVNWRLFHCKEKEREDDKACT